MWLGFIPLRRELQPAAPHVSRGLGYHGNCQCVNVGQLKTGLNCCYSEELLSPVKKQRWPDAQMSREAQQGAAGKTETWFVESRPQHHKAQHRRTCLELAHNSLTTGTLPAPCVPSIPFLDT